MLKLLNESKIVHNYDIYDYKQGSNFYYMKAIAILIDGTFLYIRKYYSEVEYNYSYHWQKENGELIIRWDNSPHHKNIETYPHHKHIGNSVQLSKEITLKDVMQYISKKLVT